VKTEETNQSTVGQVVAVVAKYLAQHAWLVAGIVLVGLVQALLVKAPFLLLKEIGDRLAAPHEVAPAASDALRSNWLFESFEGVKNWLLGFVGIPSGPQADLGAVITGTSTALAVMALLGAIAVYSYRVLAQFASMRVVVDLRNDVCAHLMGLGVRFFGRHPSGDLISRLSNDTTTLMRSFNLVFENMVLEPMMLSINLLLAFSIAWQIGVVALVLIPVLAVPMGRFGRKIHRGSGKSLEALGEATDALAQMFSGFRTIKAFQLEAREVNEFRTVNERFFHRSMRMFRAKAKSQGTIYLIYMGGLAIALLLFQRVLSSQSQFSTGDILMGLAALGTIYTHVKRTARTYNVVKESQGALERIQGLLAEVNEIDSGTRKLESVRGEVEFDNVSFSYYEEPVLSNLSFRVEAGQKVAFVGASGAGKSTILDLLTRFYDPIGGRILIDGHDLRELDLISYLSCIATVDQSPFLFNRSIRDNILMGRPGATEAELIEASKAALVDEFVSQLRDG